MSFSQVLPHPPSHFAQGSNFYPPSSYQGHGSISSMIQQPLLPLYQEQQPRTISPRLLPSSPPYGQIQVRALHESSQVPPTRERTPIRHHRPSVARARSSSRPDLLLAYAEQQEQHQRQQQSTLSVLPSHSAPNTPPEYQPADYFVPVPPVPYTPQPNYYAPAPLPQGQTHFMSAEGTLAQEQVSAPYYSIDRSALHHDVATFNPQDAMYLRNPIPATLPPMPSLPSSTQLYPPTSQSLESSSSESFRVLASRPKPQCWDHGCNGRQFSTFSNLLRHQREKSGSASKSVCPHCGTEFTRTTARNGHMYGGKCKGRSEADQGGSDDGSPGGATG